MTSAVIVTKALDEDVLYMIDSLCELRKLTVWGRVPGINDYAHATTYLLNMMDDDDQLVLVAKQGGNYVGCCGCVLTTNIFIPSTPYVYEKFLQTTLPGAGKEMWKRVKQWGIEKGAVGGAYARPTKSGEIVKWKYWKRY